MKAKKLADAYLKGTLLIWQLLFQLTYGCGSLSVDPGIKSALGSLLNYTWMITSSGSNLDNFDNTRNNLYEISLCEPSNLCPSTGGASSLCKVTNQANATESTNIGLTSQVSLKNITDGYMLKTTGTKCGKRKNNEDLFYTSYIFFHCGKTLGVPVLIDDFSDKTTINLIQNEPLEGDELDECSVVFKWSTNQACSHKRLKDTTEIPCYLTLTDKLSSGQSQYMTVDFSPLMLNEAANFRQVLQFDDSMDIALDLCRYGDSKGTRNACNSEYASCASYKNGSHISFGFNSNNTDHFRKITNGHYQLTYDVLVGYKVSTCSSSRMNINLLCPRSRAGSDSPVLQSSDQCNNYEIDWYTEHACGTHKFIHAEDSCILYDREKNIDIDLTSLNKPEGYAIDYRRGLANYRYVLNVCGPLNNARVNELIGKVKDADKISSVQTKPDDAKFFKALGKYTKTKLIYSDGQLVMTLEDGDVCGTKMARKTVIKFRCSQTSEAPKFLQETDCIYYFEWATPRACVYDCGLQYNNQLFDLSVLTKYNGNYWPLVNDLPTNTTSRQDNMGLTNVILNVCDKLNLKENNLLVESEKSFVYKEMQEKCSRDSSICAYDQTTKSAVNLGTFSTDLDMDVKDEGTGHLRLIYKNGDICDKDQRRTSTIINFICDLNADNYAGQDLPRLAYKSHDKCLFEIYWRTREACPKTRLVSHDCRITSDQFSFDLNPLSAPGPTLEAKHDHEFDSDDEDESKTQSAKYKFQICGKRLETLARPYLTFWDLNADEADSFQFTESPQLVYDNGLLYFKYENRTSGRHAIVKLECSYEESISSNSNDFSLFKSRLNEMLVDLNDEKKLAFVLLKTKYACSSGSNQMNSHFQEFSSFFSTFNNSASLEISKCIIYESSDGQASFKPGMIDMRTKFQPHYVDLRRLLKKFRADEKDLMLTITDPHLVTKVLKLSDVKSANVRFYTRLCSKSFEYAKFQSQSHQQRFAFGALLYRDDKNKAHVLSLGNKLSGVQFVGESDLTLSYTEGDICLTNGLLNYTFEINFKCWQKHEEYLAFVKTSRGGCHFHFEWLTAEVCRRQDISLYSGQNCQLTDPYTDSDVDFNNNYNSFQYDFSQLKSTVFLLNDTKLLFKENDIDRGYFKFSVCEPIKSSECSQTTTNNQISSCSISSSKPTLQRSEGQSSDQLNYENGLVSLTYSNGQTCSEKSFDKNILRNVKSLPQEQRSSSTRIEFYCDYNEDISQVSYLYFSQFKCQHVFGFYTYLACPPYLSRESIDTKCQIEFTEMIELKVRQTKHTSITAVNSLMLLFENQNSLFKFKFENYQLTFRVCGLLPKSMTRIGDNNNNSKNPYGSCFDKYGFSLGSACLYDETDQLKQVNMGISKGPFRKSGDSTLSMYSLSYTLGGQCESDRNERMQLNLVFKCDQATISGTVGYTITKLESSNKCKLNLQIKMGSFCKQASQLEFEAVSDIPADKQTNNNKNPIKDSYCTHTEPVGDKILNVYNMTRLSAPNGYIIASSPSALNVSIAFNVCQSITRSQCELLATSKSNPRDSAVTNKNNDRGSVCIYNKVLNEYCFISSNSTDQFQLIEDSYRLRSTYKNMNGCQNFKQDVIVDFICNKTSLSTANPRIKTIDQDRVYLEMESQHACPVIKFLRKETVQFNSCEYYPNTGGEGINDPDLEAESINFSETESSYVEKKPMSTFNPFRPNFEYIFNLCSGSNAHCAEESAVCMIDRSGNTSAVSLGKFNKLYNTYNRDQNGVYLVFEEGTVCSESNQKHSVRINLVCPKPGTISLQSSPEFKYRDKTRCRTNFEWFTPLGCVSDGTRPKPEKEVVKNCRIYNNLYNYTFDLSELYSPTQNTHVQSDSYEYLINPCTPKDQASSTSATITRVDAKKNSVVFGHSNQISLNHLTSHIMLGYEGEKCNPKFNRSALILFECSPFEDLPPVLIAEEECSITLRWAVKSACIQQMQSHSNQCSVYYANHLYNLQPLVHSLDSWEIRPKSSNISTFWLNICQGVGNQISNGCPQEAAICMKNNTDNKTEVLAFTDQMHMKVKEDAYSIEVVYNNTRRPCVVKGKPVQDYTVTYIEFSCGQTIGKPKLLDNNDKAVKEMPFFLSTGANECLYVFEWSSRIACKNSTQIESRVDVKNGVMHDEKHSQIEIDMSAIFNSKDGFVDDDDRRESTKDSFKYYIQFNGKMPQLQSVPACQNSIICRLDEKQSSYKSLGNTVEFYAFDVYSEILEVSIRSNEVCSNTNEKLQTIIRFFCDPTKSGKEPMNSFNFESEFDECVYTFDWPTQLLCVKDKWLSESSSSSTTTTTNPMKTDQTATTSFNAPGPAVTTNPIISSQNKIPSFVVILIIIVVIIIFVLILNNLPEIVETKGCRLLRHCGRRMCECTWIFGGFAGLNNISWFGTVKRRIRPQRRSRVQGVRYSKLRRDDDADETDNLFDSSGDEVAAVFVENDRDQSVLRLSELTPVSVKIRGSPQTSSPQTNRGNKTTRFQAKPLSTKATPSDSSTFDEQLIEIDANENVKNSTFLARRDSHSNMLNNTESDDDLIVV